MRKLLLSTLVSGLTSLSFALVAYAGPPSVGKPMTATLWVPTGSGGGIGGVGAGVGAPGAPAFAGGVGGTGGTFGGGIGAPGAKGVAPGPGSRMNPYSRPSVIWYPPEYSAKEQRRTDQDCQFLYQKAKTTGTPYWRSPYNSCIATR
jgi:hypothetical protein